MPLTCYWCYWITACINMKSPLQLTFTQTARRTSPVVHKQPPVISDADKFKVIANCRETTLIARSLPFCPSLSTPVTQGERDLLSSPRCAPALVYRHRNETSQPRTAGDDMRLTVASRYFVPPANTLLLNLRLHTRRASGKGAHPPYILKETHSRAVTHWYSARCRNSSSDA